MKQRISLILGVFTVMALSNAVVPILPFFASEAPSVQGAIFSAYFFGAFLSVIPAGILGDRYGTKRCIKSGLFLTVVTGAAIFLVPHSPLLVIAARGIEGIGAGFFVASALSWVNVQKDSRMLSGYYFAALNVGLLSGLLITGWLADFGTTLGLLVFTVLSMVPFLLSFTLSEEGREEREIAPVKDAAYMFRWIYLSSFIIVGTTGVISSLYPEFTGELPIVLSLQLAAMNMGTVITSLVAPRIRIQPVPLIRVGGIVMALAVAMAFFAPEFGWIAVILVFAAVGGVVGFVFVAQMEYLAQSKIRQGTVVGIFNASAYGGMAFMPFIAGLVVDAVGYSAAFGLATLLCGCVALFIGRCECTILDEPA
ncbi:MFS transporter [Methanomicrobiaceae archaeon CYW5]|uniref:MFS transporter n=1 Tax=Methanovulcanius yangii TaxID=1789227 RepID=UPI0029C9D9EF|nr:MFS transporter [Methanovulcanius yangii]MBT8507375.1 MFS transporter [Methanovulcanius yangii]